MNRIRLALALSVFALAGGMAVAQAPGTRLRGTVERMEGATLELKAADGREIKVALAPGFSVGGMVAAQTSDIAKGSFIGVGAKPQADGALLAVQVGSSRKRCAARAKGTGPGACCRTRP